MKPGTRNAVLEMIRTGIELQRRGLGVVPSMREMACWLGCKVKTVFRHVERLERDGRIRRVGKGLARSCEVLEVETIRKITRPRGDEPR